MSAFRAVTKHTRTISAQLRVAPSHARTFFSPFPAANKSPLTTPPSASSTASTSSYTETPSTVYVVSEPHPSDAPYSVPAGAYPTSAPYVNFAHTEAPSTTVSSSTSASPAHPNLTSRVPHNEAGVGQSAGVRNAEAPGPMSAGSFGGLGLMDAKSTKRPENGELADRNPPPIQEVGEEVSRKGLKEAWKDRK